jgi:hypothetical protein
MKKEMEMLKREVRAVIAAYDPKADFDETVFKLAAIGYRMMDVMTKAQGLFPLLSRRF